MPEAAFAAFAVPPEPVPVGPLELLAAVVVPPDPASPEAMPELPAAVGAPALASGSKEAVAELPMAMGAPALASGSKEALPVGDAVVKRDAANKVQVGGSASSGETPGPAKRSGGPGALRARGSDGGGACAVGGAPAEAWKMGEELRRRHDKQLEAWELTREQKFKKLQHLMDDHSRALGQAEEAHSFFRHCMEGARSGVMPDHYVRGLLSALPRSYVPPDMCKATMEDNAPENDRPLWIVLGGEGSGGIVV